MKRGRTIQNIPPRRRYQLTAVGNREIALEGNVVDLSLLGIGGLLRM